MRYNRSTGIVAASLLSAFILAACGPKDETANRDTLTETKATGTVPDIKVAEVSLGKAIGADMKVTTPTTEFAPKDTIYVSVSTTGMAQNATLMLTVTPLAGTADSTNTVNDNKTISPSAPTVTEFHFARPAGFKAGKYKAEVYLNGGLADVKEFEIKASK